MKISKFQISKNFFLSIGMSYFWFSIIGTIYFLVDGMDKDSLGWVMLIVSYASPYAVYRFIPTEIMYGQNKIKSYLVIYLSLILLTFIISVLNYISYPHSILISLYDALLTVPVTPFAAIVSLFF